MTIVVAGLPDGFVKDLVEQFRRIRAVEGIVLAGSAAHDELMWWVTDDATRLLSDIEVGIVTSNLSIRSRAREKAAMLTRRYRYDVEPFLLTPRRLRLGSPKNLSFRRHRPNVFMYDLIHGSRWLWGNGMAGRSPVNHELPVWEGIRLILNRFAEGAPQLLPWLDHAERQPRDDAALSRWLVKWLVAAGDAHLLSTNQYRPSYRRRALLWQRAQSRAGAGRNFSVAISNAYAARCGRVSFACRTADPASVLHGMCSMLERLIAQHGSHDGLLDAQTAHLDDWIGYFSRHPVPVRHQAPSAALDARFETLITGAQALRYGFKPTLTLVATALRHNVPAPVIAYGLIACGLFRYARDGHWQSLKSTLRRYTDKAPNEDLGYTIRRLWNAFCK